MIESCASKGLRDVISSDPILLVSQVESGDGLFFFGGEIEGFDPGMNAVACHPGRRRDGGMPLSIPPGVCAVGEGQFSRVIHRLP